MVSVHVTGQKSCDYKLLNLNFQNSKQGSSEVNKFHLNGFLCFELQSDLISNLTDTISVLVFQSVLTRLEPNHS